jgi:hypothetical protein
MTLATICPILKQEYDVRLASSTQKRLYIIATFLTLNLGIWLFGIRAGSSNIRKTLFDDCKEGNNELVKAPKGLKFKVWHTNDRLSHSISVFPSIRAMVKYPILPVKLVCVDEVTPCTNSLPLLHPGISASIR